MKELTTKILAWAILAGLVLSSCQVPVFADGEGGEVSGLLKNLELGRPFRYKNLTIVPIYAKRVKETQDYLTLDEAVNSGYIQITEIDGGQVPQVKVVNKSHRYIFLMQGEILTGAKQNRLVGRDVLLGPYNREVIVPVYCVEQGRWTEKSPQFYSGKITAAPSFRRKAAVGASQSDMWSGIASYAAKMDVSSETGDLACAYNDERIESQAAGYVEALKESIPRLEEDAVGVAVAVGERIITIDILETPKLFAKLWPKLLRSYAMEAIAYYNENGAEITQEQVKDILGKLYQRKYERRNAIALGTDLSLTMGDMTSNALAFKASIIHLCVFPNNDSREPIIDNTRVPIIYD